MKRFGKSERIFCFYKHIYPFFVKLFLREDAKIFLQLDFIKNGFVKSYKHPFENISVLSPSIIAPKSDFDIEYVTDTIKVFYLVSGYFYMNHRVVAETLKSDDSFDCKVFFTTKYLEDLDSSSVLLAMGIMMLLSTVLVC